MREVADLVGAERAADAGTFRPAMQAGLEEVGVDDQLAAAFEEIEKAHSALGPVEGIGLLHRKPRHPPPFGGQCGTRACMGFLLYETPFARSLPFLRRYDRLCLHLSSPPDFDLQCRRVASSDAQPCGLV